MVFKKIFGGSRNELRDDELTIEDLFVLERYEEAEGRLVSRLKDHPHDLHAHLRLADVYIQLRQLTKAVDEYVFVAEEYASDGFFDKGIALLLKVSKLVPMDETLPLKIEKIRTRKRLELVREQALEGLRQSLGDSGASGTSVLQLGGLWGKLVRSTIVQRLDGPQLKHLFSCMSLERFEEGHALAEQNSDSQGLFLLVSGEVVATASVGGGKPVELRRFGPGDLLGEASLLERKPWPASYVTDSATTALHLDRSGLERALTGNSDPRGLLKALREQAQDQAVAEAIYKLNQ